MYHGGTGRFSEEGFCLHNLHETSARCSRNQNWSTGPIIDMQCQKNLRPETKVIGTSFGILLIVLYSVVQPISSVSGIPDTFSGCMFSLSL